MRLWEKTKRLFGNRKKKRVKKTEQFPSPTLTAAEKLIMNNWGIAFKFEEPARAGEKRARVRMAQKMKANAAIPDNRGPMTRQVRRQVEPREFKKLRSEVKAMQAKRKREELRAFPRVEGAALS